MHYDNAWKTYFEYLYSICMKGKNPDISYRLLLEHLFTTQFKWSLSKDINRIYDGYEMRKNYFKDHNIFYEKYNRDAYPVSILEIIVALAQRCEETIMLDTEYGDRTSQWIWEMIISLGLGGQTDEHFDKSDVDRKIKIFLQRRYSKNGKGGLFTIKSTKNDLRKVEIWCQMLWYLDTIN